MAAKAYTTVPTYGVNCRIQTTSIPMLVSPVRKSRTRGLSYRRLEMEWAGRHLLAFAVVFAGSFDADAVRPKLSAVADKARRR